jgi:hypothetical protein
MKTILGFLISIWFCFGLTTSQIASAEEFPLSPKGYQATVVNKEGVNSSKAIAIGKVRGNNAIEYCERDPGGETQEYGGKLTKEQCVEKVLKEEEGKKYLASADCSKKTIKTSWGETFTLVGKDSVGSYIWRDKRTGRVLDGSNASGAPVVEGQFRMLCPGFIGPAQ